jgi:hypothetical protein
MENVKNYLVEENLYKRLLSVWIIGIMLNSIAWHIGYNFLPQGILKEIFLSSPLVPVQGEMEKTILSILLYNIVIASGLIFVANLYRIKWFPLGYVPVFFHWALYGLFLGTNSFDLGKIEKISPSFLHLIGSVGFIEISAYTFLAVASINLYLYRQQSFWTLKAEKVRDWSQVRLVQAEYILIAIAYLLIIWAAYKESISIFLKGLL